MLVKNLIVLFVLCAIRTIICYDEPLEVLQYLIGKPKHDFCMVEGTVTEGDSCQQLGLGGICRRYENCPVAIQSVRKKGRHNLRVCGFAGLQEVVCCPGEVPSDRHPTLETSTIDKLTVWIGGNSIQSNNSKEKNKPNNDGRIKGKRKAELMCEKNLKENNVTVEIDFHVLNGEDAAEGQFPHMAVLGVEDALGNIDWGSCGASLIAPRFLLTAAHCSICAGCKPIVKVRLGVVDHNDPKAAQDIDVKRLISAAYNIASRHNDIALVELVQDVKMSKNVYPACLYTRSDNPIGLLVSGWGQTDSTDTDSRPNRLQFARLEPVEVQQCNSSLLQKNTFTSKVILSTQICAISNQSDACLGDSGGPLQIERKTGGYDIVGIVSYGVVCGTTLPGVYTRVSAYLDWIEENVWP